MRQGVRNTLLVVFTLSGFSGLIYESIWTHYLKLFLGHAAYAQTLVLAIFMGGMAIGSWICSRSSGRWKNLLLGYAVTELAVGILALAFHPIYVGAVGFAVERVIPAIGSPEAVDLFQWVLSATLILPQSILLGMTFPLMSAGLIRIAPDRPGRTLALLYFTNSMGAAVGVLVSGFALIRWVGLPGTIAVAGAINVALALTVWSLARGEVATRRAAEPAAATEAAADPARFDARATDRGWFRSYLLVAALTGASSFAYEIGWIRLLSLVLGSSTHAFELMLSAFILGLALGGLWVKGRIDRLGDPVRFLGLVQILMGTLAVATLLVYARSFEAMRWLLGVLGKNDAGYLGFNLASNGIAIVVMLPATVCAGMTLPVITYTLLRRGHGERSIGAVYAANTVGAIAGVFASVHLGLPLLGLEGLLVSGAAIDVALGAWLLWRAGARDRRALALGTVGVGALVLTVAFVRLDPYAMASGVYRDGFINTAENSTLLFHADGKTATVSVLVNGNNTTIRTNGKVDAAVALRPGAPPTHDESTVALVAILPMAHAPRARTAAVIGMGSGLTTHTLLANPDLASVDTVEIEPQMVEAARLFRPRNERAYEDPRSRIHIDDAKTFFAIQRRKYDLIVSEPSNPWVSGVAGLFSTEFYRVVKRHLAPGGILAQWIQLYEIDLDLVASVLKAIDGEFSDWVVYATNDGDVVVLARADGPMGPLDLGVLALAPIKQALGRIGIETVYDLEYRRVGSRALLRRLVQSFPFPANSDYFPVLDQNAAKARFLNAYAGDLVTFTRAPLPILELTHAVLERPDGVAITPTEILEPTQAPVRAAALERYLEGEGLEAAAQLDPEVLEEAARLRRRLSRCATRPDDSERLEVGFMVLVELAARLPVGEMDRLLARLERPECVASLSPRERDCAALVRAIGDRNGHALAVAARHLLAHREDLSGDGLRILVASGMLGSLLEGDRAAACRLWSDLREDVRRAGPLDLQLRLLVSECSAG